MNLKKKLLRDSCLYAVIDKKVIGKRSVFSLVKKIKNLGVDIIQYRDKDSQKEDVIRVARRLARLLLNSSTLFIINDYLDIAKIVNCDGIHLGQDDISIEIARKILGKDKIIGKSCHSLKEAIVAQSKGVDYISIGPIFSTPTKPGYKAVGLDLIKECKRKIKIPFFVIGGINENNIDRILSAGAKRAAVCRAICQPKNVALIRKKIAG